MKKVMQKIMGWMLVLCMMVAVAVPAQNAYAATTNQKAHTAYQSRLKSIKKTLNKVPYPLELEYKYADVVGTKTDEMIVYYHEGGSNYIFRIYNYQSGKAVKILDASVYGFEKLTSYKSTKSIVVYSKGHGGEIYRYFTFKKGAYKLVASRSRQAIAGGAAKNGSWTYYGSKNNKITKTKFGNLTSSLTTGKKSTVKYSYTSFKEYR